MMRRRGWSVAEAQVRLRSPRVAKALAPGVRPFKADRRVKQLRDVIAGRQEHEAPAVRSTWPDVRGSARRGRVLR